MSGLHCFRWEVQLQTEKWLSVGGGYLVAAAVCLCVLGLGPRAQRRHTHTHRDTHTQKNPQRLY